MPMLILFHALPFSLLMADVAEIKTQFHFPKWEKFNQFRNVFLIDSRRLKPDWSQLTI